MYFDVFIERDIIRKELVKEVCFNYNKYFYLNVAVIDKLNEEESHLVNINEFNYDLTGSRFNYLKELENLRVAEKYNFKYYISIRRRLFYEFLIFQCLIMSIGYYLRFSYGKYIFLNNSLKIYNLVDKNIFNRMEGDLGFKDNMEVDLKFKGDSVFLYSLYYVVRYLKLKLVKNDKKYIKR